MCLAQSGGVQVGDVKEAGAEIKEGLVQRVLPMGGSFTAMIGNEIAEARGVLIATGIPRVALIEGEENLVGMGVSYCATCDGMLYRGGSVAVIAQDASYEEDVRFLQGICRVDYYQERKHAAPEGVTACEGKPKKLSIAEDGKVLLATDKGEKVYDCVFILRPAVALSQLLPKLETAGSAIMVDEHMRTNIAGVFAAGDVTGEPYQIARAIGQGNVAALAIASYFAELEKE